jgi:hypothetical protein
VHNIFMTSLIDKTTLESLGIDTLERGIVLALLLLRNAGIQDGKTGQYYSAIRISTSVRAGGETYQANINATAKIPYHSNTALVAGMDLIAHLSQISDRVVVPTFAPLTQTPNAPALPIKPNEIDTLEKYLLFYSQFLAASILPTVDRIKISFLEEDPTEPSVLIDYLLPLDWGKYLLTNNLIEAVKLIPRSTTPAPDPNIPSLVLIGNSYAIGNLTFIGN